MPVALALGGGLSVGFVCLVSGLNTEKVITIVAEMVAARCHGGRRRAGSVVLKEGSPVDPRLKGDVLGPTSEPTASSLAESALLPMPTRFRALAGDGSSLV